MRKFIQVLFILILILSAFSLTEAAQARSTASAPNFSSAYDLINEVNALRASKGLYAYQANSILMGIAQTQAEYLASSGVSSTHYDAYGRSPYQRALAAGYPLAGDLSLGGFFSENVVGGIGLDAEGAVEIWMGDAPHQTTMLSDTLQDVGAGVAVYGNTYYYVLDCGLSTGGTPVAYTPPVLPNQSTPTIVPNTPNADGSIIHIVQSNDTIYGIALAYGVSYDNILDLNGLKIDSTIYVNQELTIRSSNTPTLTPTSTVRPTITSWPTSTPTLTKTAIPPTATPSPGLAISAAGNAVVIIVVAALVIAGLSALLGRKPKG